MTNVKKLMRFEGTDIEEDMWACDVLLIEEVADLMMGGGYTNHIAWDIIKSVRAHDEQPPHVMG